MRPKSHAQERTAPKSGGREAARARRGQASWEIRHSRAKAGGDQAAVGRAQEPSGMKRALGRVQNTNLETIQSTDVNEGGKTDRKANDSPRETRGKGRPGDRRSLPRQPGRPRRPGRVGHCPLHTQSLSNLVRAFRPFRVVPKAAFRYHICGH